MTYATTSPGGSTRSGKPRSWTTSQALARAIALPVVLTATGLALGRVELVVLLLPLAVSAVGALSGWGRFGSLLEGQDDGRRAPPPDVYAVGASTVDEGRDVTVAVTIEASNAEIVTVLLPPAEQDQPGTWASVRAPKDERRQIVCTTRARTWGLQQLSRPDHLSASPDGLLVDGPREGAPYAARVLPAVPSRLQTGPLPPRPAGMVGAHRTRRPGEGSDLYDISPFRPGDRLKRIDWRVTARQAGPASLGSDADGTDATAEIYTRHTLVDADADVVCCLDNRYDLRPDVTTWGTAIEAADLHELPTSSVDVAVDTVASVAAAYLAHGDRVGVLDLARPMDMARLGSGSRHLLRLRNHLARHTRRPGSGESARLPRRTPWLPPGAIVIVTSVFMDDGIVDLIGSWRRSGHAVVAVDVLPDLMPIPPKLQTVSLALRVVLAERQERMTALRARGVTVSPADPSQLWLNLATMARMPGRRRR